MNVSNFFYDQHTQKNAHKKSFNIKDKDHLRMKDLKEWDESQAKKDFDGYIHDKYMKDQEKAKKGRAPYAIMLILCVCFLEGYWRYRRLRLKIVCISFF